MKYGILDNIKYVLASVAQRDRILYAILFGGLSILILIGTGILGNSTIEWSKLWDHLVGMIHLAVWLLLLVTLNALGALRKKYKD
jgi:hypothetical protein